MLHLTAFSFLLLLLAPPTTLADSSWFSRSHVYAVKRADDNSTTTANATSSSDATSGDPSSATGSTSASGSAMASSDASGSSVTSIANSTSTGTADASQTSNSTSSATDSSASASSTAAADTNTTSSSSATASSDSSSTSSSSAVSPSSTANTTALGPTNSTVNFTSGYYPYPLNSSLARHNQHPVSGWTTAHERARAYLTNWTLEEKVNLTTGVGWEIGRCVGNIPAVPSQNFSGLCLEDSPLGVRDTDFVSAFPAGINVAATFDKDLMYARGYAMGQEFKGKGVNVALGPMTNMGRVAAGGRNWEGFGGDPYLSGWATEMTVRGLQDAGVQACVKHFIGNEQEHNRNTESSNIDDRTMREIYSHPFLRAVAADVASVMCSYNLVNNSWACQNSETMNGILKTDFGFQGYVLSDWTATHSGVLSANSGLDMTMPGDITFDSFTSFFGENLTMAVNNGSVEMARVDDMAERIMSGYFLLNQDQDYPAVNFDAFRRLSEENNSHVDVQGDHYQVIEHIGAASTVLLKNDNGALPLNKPRTIALIGNDLGPSYIGPNGCPDRGCDNGTLAMGWGSGTDDFPYLIDPLEAIQLRARHDHTDISWWFSNYDLAGAATTATGVEVAVVGINSDSGEDYIVVDGNEGDRNNLTAWQNGDALVQAVAAVNNNTVVVVHSVGPLIIEAWIDNPNVTAVLWAGIPGQESGNSLVDIMYGSYKPSGRLPYTIARKRDDYSAEVIYEQFPEPGGSQIDYSEGLNIDYRHFLSANITPRFEFGFGLSYTSFNYSNVQIFGIEGGPGPVDHDLSINGNRSIGYFLSPSLQKPRYAITADIQNTGNYDGCEIPQLYLKYPESAGEPPRVLRDFTRINLQPWQTQTIYFTLSRYDVAIWNVTQQAWRVPEGEFEVIVAKSSMDEGVTGTFCPSGKC